MEFSVPDALDAWPNLNDRLVPSAVVSGMGVVLLAIPLYDVWDDVANLQWHASRTFVENSWSIFLAIGLVGGGVWLAGRDWRPHHVRNVAKWTVAGSVGAALLFGWVVGLQLWAMGRPKPYVLALDGVLISAETMFVIGVNNTRASIRAEESEAERDRFAGLFENITDPIVEVELRDGDPRSFDVNPAFAERFDDDPAAVFEDVVADLDVDLETVLERRDRREGYETEATRETNGERGEFFVRLVPIHGDERDVGRTDLFVVLTDVSERERRRRELEQRVRAGELVATLGRRAMTQDDLDVLFARTIDGLADVFDTEYAEVLELSADGDRLSMRDGVGWPDVVVSEATVERDRQSMAEFVLRSDTAVVAEDVEAEDRFEAPELVPGTDVGNTLAATVGPVDDPWGILAVHGTAPREYAEHERQFVLTVANTLYAAIRRRRNERELEHHEEQLRSVNRLYELVQQLTRAILQQSSREEMERLVCEHLVDAEAYTGAWVGGVDADADRVAVSASDGESDPVDEALPRTAAPVRRALDGSEVTVVEDVGARDHPRWHAYAGDSLTAAAVVPIVYEETTYGVFAVFTDREEAFGTKERAVLAQVGEVLGHAFNAFRRKQARVAETAVEMEFEVPGYLEEVVGVEDAAGTITVDRVVLLEQGTYLLYGTVADEAVESLRTFVNRRGTLEDLSLYEAVGERTRFHARASDLFIVSVVADHGGEFASMELVDGDLRTVVEIPAGRDSGSFLGLLRERFPEVNLRFQREVPRDADFAARLERVLEEDLTDRQRSALEASYAAGYFEWPREGDGEEVAETMDISSSTFHQHLREGQRKLLGAVFGDSRSPDRTGDDGRA